MSKGRSFGYASYTSYWERRDAETTVEGFTKTWYGGFGGESTGLPDIGTPDFMAFARGILSLQTLANAIGIEEYSQEMSPKTNTTLISSGEHDTKKRIVYPAWFFDKKEILSRWETKEPAAYALTLINGSAILAANRLLGRKEFFAGKGDVGMAGAVWDAMKDISYMQWEWSWGGSRRFVRLTRDLLYPPSDIPKGITFSTDRGKKKVQGLQLLRWYAGNSVAVAPLLGMYGEGLLEAVQSSSREKVYEILSRLPEDQEEQSNVVYTLAANIDAGQPIVDPIDKSKEMVDRYENRMVKVIDILQSNSHMGYERLLDPTVDYAAMEKLRLMKTKNHPPGEPLERGPVLVPHRVYRIATDSKMFAHRETLVVPKTPEIIVLMDYSGSMSGKTLAVTSEGRGIFKMLTDLDIPSGVYGHTSYPLGGSDVPHIYIIATYKLPITTRDVEERFYKATGIPRHNNYDGIVIKWLVKNGFSTRVDRRRLLIVLSDGYPAGANYEGIGHTKMIIDQARRAGITVMSFALPGAEYHNDSIYGKAYNIHVKPETFVEQFTAVLVSEEKERLE